MRQFAAIIPSNTVLSAHLPGFNLHLSTAAWIYYLRRPARCTNALWFDIINNYNAGRNIIFNYFALSGSASGAPPHNYGPRHLPENQYWANKLVRLSPSPGPFNLVSHVNLIITAHLIRIQKSGAKPLITNYDLMLQFAISSYAQQLCLNRIKNTVEIVIAFRAVGQAEPKHKEMNVRLLSDFNIDENVIEFVTWACVSVLHFQLANVWMCDSNCIGHMLENWPSNGPRRTIISPFGRRSW